MDEELDLDLGNEEITRKDNRIKSLSDKVKLTSEERDALAKEKEEITLAKADAEKERDFFKGFNEVSVKYSGANEFQEKIWEKVKQGYDIEDATVSILNKEGKLNPSAPKIERESPVGGSASTSMTGNVDKSPQEMGQDERRSALLDLEARGELSL